MQLGEERPHLQNQLSVDTHCPSAHGHSPSGPACFRSNNCSGAPKEGTLLGEAAGDQKERGEWSMAHRA